MDEEQIESQELEQQQLPAPPRFRNKFFKIATLTLLFLALFFAIGFTGLEASSSSKFCSSCHEMKPEYYTWKASSHGEVDCVNCHIEPGVENLAKAKGNGLVQLFKKQTQTYTAPIRMPKDIPDSSCERCHNVFKREVTPSGDVIIPHDKHKKEGVECIQCHSGVAHGKIADRKMTYKSDYMKWDDQVGQAAMEDVKWIRPDMDTCMECHKARKVTTECKACHTSGMVPNSHKKDGFVQKGTHGQLAKVDLKKCNVCHKDMSKTEIPDMEEEPAISKVLSSANTANVKVNHMDYAKKNTFCKDCHSERPDSHTKSFMYEHGEKAKDDKQKCLACHNYQPSGGIQTKMVSCGSCHPALHKGFDKTRHPVPLAEKQKVTNYCYTCHSKPRCSACHRE